MRALGQPPEGELAPTPDLVAEAWCNELLSGYTVNPAQILGQASIASDSRQLVVIRDVFASTICPHHLLPAFGRADVAYLPDGHIAGLGAVVRTLHAITRRLILQESAGNEMADALMTELGAAAAACRLRMTHTCLALRGAREPATVETLALAGTFRNADRDLVLGALG